MSKKKITVSKAIGEALHEEMLRDENVFIMGEDMAVMGNVFAITKGFLEEFGPNRTEEGKWPDIYPANAFIGNYLRLDMLLGLGYRETVKKNIEGYFGYMANTTGTLWENISTVASCNHGFASYVLCWLDQLK